MTYGKLWSETSLFLPGEGGAGGRTAHLMTASPSGLAGLVKADLSITLASGQLYADDQLAESVDEFVSGSVAMETDA